MPPFDPNNLIESFAVAYKLINTSLPLAVPRPELTTTNIQGTSVTIQPLLESSVYQLAVYAITSSGSSPGDQIDVVRLPNHSNCFIIDL